MIGVSARSYVAAGLATAVAGAVVASPMLAQNQFQLPSVSSASVELSALATDAERTAERAGGDAAAGVKAVRDVVRRAAESVPGAATAIKSNPLVKAAAVTVTASAVQAIADAKSKHATSAPAVQHDSVVSPAVTPSPAVAAALPGSPNLGAVLGIPLLLASLPVGLVSDVAFEVAGDAGFGLQNVIFGLAQGDMATVQFGFTEIGNTLPDIISDFQTDISRTAEGIREALGIDDGTGDDEGAAVTSALKAIDAKKQGAEA